MSTVETYRGPTPGDQLGVTLMHEHLFVRNPELELTMPDPEWNESDGIETAIRELTQLHHLGVRTVVDLTVPGLGRDGRLVTAVAQQVGMHLVASTGWYTPAALPLYFAFHGPGRLVDEPDALAARFIDDITTGMAHTGVRAGMLKVVTDAAGITDDVARVMVAAAEAQRATGVPLTTHSHPASRNGLEQQTFLCERGVEAERIIIGHSGDTQDVEYLMEIMDRGSTVGLDRFGMEHVLPDDRRIGTLLALIQRGYTDRIVLSHDAAIYSHVTPPSWRARHAPRWRMDTIHRHVLPALRTAGVSPEEIDQMLVMNPRRLLVPAT